MLISKEIAEGGFGRDGNRSPAARAAQPNFIQNAFEIEYASSMSFVMLLLTAVLTSVGLLGSYSSRLRRMVCKSLAVLLPVNFPC